MKRFIAIAALAFLIPSMADATTWVFTRHYSFPSFGKTKATYEAKGTFNYPHSKTLIEKNDVLPYRYQAGFCQRDPFMPAPKHTYQLEVP
jgi:hypothetical protein